MVRNKNQAGPSSINNAKSSPKSTKRENNEQDLSSDLSSENDVNTPSGPKPSVHKQNLYVVSFPIIILFNIMRTVLYQLFVIFKFIYSTTSRIFIKPVREQAIEVVIDKDTNCSINMSNQPSSSRVTGPGPADPLLAKQKHHHRRAFEYISKALKIDEENEGDSHCFCVSYKY